MSSKTVAFPSFFSPVSTPPERSVTGSKAAAIADAALLAMKHVNTNPVVPPAVAASKPAIADTSLPEFNEMLTTAENVLWKRSLQDRCTRTILRGHTPKNNDPSLFKKLPRKGNEQQETDAPYEELAYLLSRALQLPVVPPTMYVEGTQPYILQKAVDVAEEQPHFNQNYTATTGFVPKNVQEAGVFSVIACRHDGHERNSVIDKNQHFHEVDNDYIGYSGTDSWLIDKFPEMTISPELRAQIAQYNEKTLESAFELFAKRHPTVKIPRKNITEHLALLQKSLLSNPNLKFKDLKTIFPLKWDAERQ